MVRLMRCGVHIKLILYSKLKKVHPDSQICPLCGIRYNEGLHRPCLDICKSEKCLNCIIKLKKCGACPPESKSCKPSPPPSPPLLVESTLLSPSEATPKLEVTEPGPASSSSSPNKVKVELLVMPKIETVTVTELKVEDPKPQPRKKLIGQPLGEEFPENVRFIPGADRRKYYCTICESRWTTKQNKKAHDHGKPKPFECTLCITNKGKPKEFSERSHYNYHMKSIHGVNSQRVKKARSKLLTNYFKLCKNRQLQKAQVSSSLSSNQQSVDSQLKPHKCPKCPARFTRRDNMTKHLRNICDGDGSK